MSVEETLKERGTIYGDYERGVIARGKILDILNMLHISEHDGISMSGKDEGYLFDIVNKLIRIGVSPHHIDSWHDIQGYAKLTEDALQRGLDNADK